MMNYLKILIFSAVLCTASAAWSLETVRVIVLPFDIYSPDDQSYAYLGTEIPDVIEKRLKENGAVIIAPEYPDGAPRTFSTAGVPDMKRIGVESGADYVIWGSMTWLGKRFSVDAKMVKTFTDEGPKVFYVEGDRIENLPGIIQDLSRDFGFDLFEREKVDKVLVKGNRRIEADAVKRRIKTRPGDVFLAKSLSEDLKSIYAMGYFDDIQVETEEGPDGKIVIFNVTEKPTIRFIRILNNRIFDDDEVKETLTIKTGSIMNLSAIRNNMRRIESLYKDKNYHNVRVSYNIQPLDNNQADLEFSIAEGEKVRIKSIIFTGNRAYSEKELEKIMKTSEKGFFSWLTSSGELNKEDLEQDIARLTAFYHNNGYIQARISDPQVTFQDEWIYVSIKIDEGPRFKVGEVDIEGDVVLSKEELLSRVKITQEAYYNRETVRNDVLLLTDIYSDEGYAFAEINPRIDTNEETLTVDIAYVARKGELVYFEKIMITGNTKTRDKVIRRELQVIEQELYSGRKLKRGIRNLYRLDYFEDIKVNTDKGSADDQMILKIDVTEKPTGTFSFGGGYSSIENLFFMASISQRNLFGRGQLLQLRAEIGGTTTRYTLSFTEPWLFDIPLSAGFDIYNWDRDYDTYDRESMGGGVRFGYPVFDFTRAYLSYNFDMSDITNIDEEEASNSVKELEGTLVTSSVAVSLHYDSRDKVFNPTEGSDHSVTVQYAGIGGDVAFTKYVAETGWYIPLFLGTVGFVHGKAGYVQENSNGILPDYERFYLGGINSLRGFDWRDISPTDEDGAKIGGDKYVQFNFEFLIPLIKKAGLVGVLFVDTGDVYDTSENIDFGNMRESAGFGFRWYSPMGPMRIEYGYILDPVEGEGEGGRWEFTMGSAF